MTDGRKGESQWEKNVRLKKEADAKALAEKRQAGSNAARSSSFSANKAAVAGLTSSKAVVKQDQVREAGKLDPNRGAEFKFAGKVMGVEIKGHVPAAPAPIATKFASSKAASAPVDLTVDPETEKKMRIRGMDSKDAAQVKAYKETFGKAAKALGGIDKKQQAPALPPRPPRKPTGMT